MTRSAPHRLTRRALLGAGASLLAAPALAQIRVDSSPLPRPRPSGLGRVDLAQAAERLIAQKAASGQVSFAVWDGASGTPLAARDADRGMAPASTAKALTAAYALDHLGPAHRYATRLLATGPLRAGRLEGDLVLAGGGDPMLDTAGLALLLDQLEALGVREIAGGFKIWAGALPQIEEVVPSQPDHLGYNPAISGLNLNYNRVHFGWRRQGQGYGFSLDARAGGLVPPVRMVTIRAAERAKPIYAYDRIEESGIEAWTVSRPALGQEGSRWLPVRRPAAYAGEVLRTLAASRGTGLALPAPEMVAVLPPGVPLAEVLSPPLSEVIRGVLRYSTNLTAEILGLSATQARTGALPEALIDSAAIMNGWGRSLGMAAPALVDHSGLSDASRVSPNDMVRALAHLGPDGPLRPLLADITLKTQAGAREPFQLRAKTGSLNFVSGLVGYVTPLFGPPKIFAILTADPARRAAIAPGDEERPAGSTSWARRSRAMQYDLVRLIARA